MSNPDYFVLGWWFLAALTASLCFGVVTIVRNYDRELAIRAGLAERKFYPYKITALASVLPRFIYIFVSSFLALSFGILFFGFLAFLWIGTWTPLLLLNFYTVMVLFGLACVTVGFHAFAALRPRFQRAIISWRISGSVIVGIVLVAFGIFMLIGDFLLPRRIMPVSIERAVSKPSLGGYAFYLYIDGKRHHATREAWSAAKAGEKLQAEMGAGSGTIFRATPILR